VQVALVVEVADVAEREQAGAAVRGLCLGRVAVVLEIGASRLRQ